MAIESSWIVLFESWWIFPQLCGSLPYFTPHVCWFSKHFDQRNIPAADGLVAGHLSVRLDAMLQAEELPAPGFRSAMHIGGMGASWEFSTEFHGKFKEFMGFLWDV